MITDGEKDEEEKVVIDYMKQVSKFHLKKMAFWIVNQSDLPLKYKKACFCLHKILNSGQEPEF